MPPHTLLPTCDGSTSHWPSALPTRAVLAPSDCRCLEGKDSPFLPSQAPETQGPAPHTLLLQGAQGEWGSGRELCHGDVVCLGQQSSPLWIPCSLFWWVTFSGDMLKKVAWEVVFFRCHICDQIRSDQSLSLSSSLNEGFGLEF